MSGIYKSQENIHAHGTLVDKGLFSAVWVNDSNTVIYLHGNKMINSVASLWWSHASYCWHGRLQINKRRKGEWSIWSWVSVRDVTLARTRISPEIDVSGCSQRCLWVGECKWLVNIQVFPWLCQLTAQSNDSLLK